MKWHTHVIHLCIILFFVIGYGSTSSAESKSTSLKLPGSVINIEKENTMPQAEENLSYLQPSDFTKELLETSKVKIDNPNLIKILNESAINKSPFSLGMRATIYLGEWPLSYKSNGTEPNWQYQKINTNFYDNRQGTANYQINYVQEAQKSIKGGLTAKVPQVEDVQKMILLSAMEKTNLPLTFETVIGRGTKHHQVYNIGHGQLGYLYTYAPAIHEKGKVTYGEVYLVIKGTKRKIDVKNVTSQSIGAWIPLQGHLNFGFQGSS